MANIRLKELIEANVDPKLVARSKETGKLVYFKSPENKAAAIKAGSHTDPKDKKDDEPKVDAKPNDMFGGDYAKDRGGEAPKSTPTPKMAGNWKPDENGKMSFDAATDVQNHLNAVLGTDDGVAEVDYYGGSIDYHLSDSENSIFVGPHYDNSKLYAVSFQGPSMNIDKIEASYKTFKNPKDALVYAGELAKANRKGLEQKYTDTADVDGQTDDELYDALYDMGYDFGEFGSDDFDEEGFADAAMSLGYRYDDKNKVWYNRDEMEESSTKLTSMIKKIKK